VPRRKGSTPVTRERVIEAALRLIDDEGIEALTMRRLARTLGVDAMALYYHLPDKQSLLRALVESVFSRLAPEETGTWQERLASWARAYRDLALAHPALVIQVMSYPDAVAVAAALANRSLHEAVRLTGLPANETKAAADLVVDYVNGYVAGAAAAAEAGTDAFDFAIQVITAGIEARARTPGRQGFRM
jgi:TetR/AcrR family tetracycline transcriptional repressor